MTRFHYKVRRALATVLWLSLTLVPACGPTTFPPVAEPRVTEGVDPFILEFAVPFIEAVRANPGDPELRGTLGLVYETNKMWSEAREAFSNAETLQPGVPQWSFHLATLAIHQGDSAEAERRLADLARRFPDFSPARYRLGVLLFENGEIEAARVEFAATARLEPRWPEARVAEAEALTLSGKPEEALRLLDEAAKLDPAYDRVHYVRGQALRELGRVAEAEAELFLGLDSKRQNLLDEISRRKDEYIAGYETQNAKAVELMDGGQYTEAIRILESVLKRLPGDAPASNNLSYAYRKVNRHEDAARLLEVSREVNPTHFPTLINLSGCYWEMGDYGRALAIADRAVELVPTNGRARHSKGLALMSLERLDEACAELEKSVQFDSSQPMVFGILADTSMRLMRFDRAEQHLLTLLEKLPGNVSAQYKLVQCQARLGKLEDAIKNYRKLETMSPNRPEIEALGKELGL